MTRPGLSRGSAPRSARWRAAVAAIAAIAPAPTPVAPEMPTIASAEQG